MSTILSCKTGRRRRAFRPGLDALGGMPLEGRNLPGAAFIGLGTLAPITATASTEIPPADGVSPRTDQGSLSGPYGGASVNSGLTNIIKRRLFLINPYTWTYVWINQVELSEDGMATTSFTADTLGTSIGKIDVLGSHTHTDIVTVYEGPQRVDANFTAPPGTSTLGFVNAQSTENSGGQRSWEVEDNNGNFNPNWTVTVDFSIDLSASPAGFNKTAYLAIVTPQITITMGMGSPYESGGPGLQVRDGSGSVLYADSTFKDGVYTGHWVVPAVPVQTVAYYSRLMTGPQGDFPVGTTGAVQQMTYGFHMTLNP